MTTSKKSPNTKQPQKLKGLLGVLFVVGLILIIPLFFAIPIQANTPTIKTTATPYTALTPQPGVESALTMTASAPSFVPTVGPTGKEPPGCTFPLAQTNNAVSAPENYSFSEPKTVPLDPSWDSISIFQWLPDNQHVLIAHSDPRQSSDLQQTIGLLNPQIGESQDYGSRFAPASARPPVWVAGLNAIIYPESLVLTSPTFNSNGKAINPPSADFQRRLLLSQGDPAHIKPVVDERVTVTNDRPSKFGGQFTIAVNSDGNQIVYLDSVGKQLYERKIVQDSLQTVPSPSFDATQWIYHTSADSTLQTGWYMTWRPNSTQIFLYSGVYNGRYTFLMDAQSGQICELNLWEDNANDWRQSWAVIARWSPNGRYLAVVRTKGPPPIDFSDLIVLDTTTGNLYQTNPTKLNPAGLETQGKHYVSDVAWAPDNQHLAAIEVFSPFSGPNIDRLFILDFLTGQSVQVASVELGSLDFATQLLWSNDGSQLIVQCPDGLCLLSIQKRAQP